MSPVCFAYIYVNIKPLQSFETQWYCEERRFGCLSILPLMQIQVPLDLKMSAYLKSKMLPDRCFIFLFLWSQKVCGIYYWNCVIREFCLALWLPTVLGAQVHYNPVSCSFWCQLKGPFYTSFLINQHRDYISFQSMPCNSIPDDFLPIYHDRIHQGFHFKALDIGCNLQHFLLGHRPFLGLHEEAISYKVM